ncbi:MAG TPA: 3-hydroxybutyryl-CoA dehydrogenase [Bdellovibrionota bacterium]|nr:3-hydroxybutyryl-CoA dehydrogenase [Bdellovibrionota bacterium]
MIKTIGVIGAGQMGGGIAQVAAQSGFSVILHDIETEFVEKGMSAIQKNLDRLVQKEKLTAAQKQEALGRIRTTTDLKAMKDADLVVEAATENIDIKLQIFQTLDEVTRPDVILGSNTSSISITKIAGATKRSDKVIGIHFMNPVPIMKLVEIIRGLLTSDETYKTSVEFVQKMGKETVTAADFPGFLVNRILCPMINEAIFALEEGIASPEDIDKAMKLGTNVPMGPLELADYIGLDTLLAIMEVLHQGLGEDKFRPAPLLRKYVAAGLLGRKTGRGFFTYNK